MALNKDYEDIPGTFVFDADRGREGYQLNQFCISLRLQKNRETFSYFCPNFCKKFAIFLLFSSNFAPILMNFSRNFAEYDEQS